MSRTPRKAQAVEDNSRSESFRFWAIFLGILGLIIFVGWKQPLRYRFMSKQAIWQAEHPGQNPNPPAATPVPVLKTTPAPPDWMWKNRKNPLN